MKAIILAAGFGDRMKPVTSVLPKPLLPLAGIPAIRRVINSLLTQGVSEIIINLHHLPNLIKNALSDFFNTTISFSEEPIILGTAGGIRTAMDRMGRESFIVINSDIMCEVNLRDLMHFHKQKQSQCTMVLRKTDDIHKYGAIAIDEESKIRRFLETGERGDFKEYMFTGVQVMHPDFLSHIDPNIYCDISKEVYPKKVKENTEMFGYVYNGYWEDIGKPDSYIRANRYFGNQTNKSNVREQIDVPKEFEIDSFSWVCEGCKIEKGAVIKNSVLLSNVKVMNKAYIANSIIGPDTLIAEGSIIENKILATIDHKIICREY
jgi:mannose-1-phosphate guanylyltransferase/phosphomannomutase